MIYRVKKFPQVEYFLNKEVAKLFDSNLKRQINKLNELDRKEKEYKKEVDLLLDLLINDLKPNELKELRKKLKKKSPYKTSILRLEHTKKEKLNDFFRRKKEKICWKRTCPNKVVQSGHLLPISYFNKKRKGVKPLQIFKNNIFNLIPICSYHHDLFDLRRGKENKLSPTDTKQIISKKRNFNKKLEKMINSELDYYKKAIQKFSSERKKLENYEKKIHDMLKRWKPAKGR